MTRIDLTNPIDLIADHSPAALPRRVRRSDRFLGKPLGILGWGLVTWGAFRELLGNFGESVWRTVGTSGKQSQGS